MSDYTLSKAEILALAIAQTDAGAILSGSTDWGVRQAVRDEVCLYVCRQCGEIARERLPF